MALMEAVWPESLQRVDWVSTSVIPTVWSPEPVAFYTFQLC